MTTRRSNSVLELGDGFNSIIGERCQTAMESLEIETRPQSETIYKLTLFENIEKYQREASAFLSGIIPVSSNISSVLNGAMKMKSQSGAQDVFYVLEIDSIDHTDFLKSTYNIKNSLEEQIERNPLQFQKQYGDEFIDQIDFGSKFVAVIHFSCRDKETKKAVMGNMGVNATTLFKAAAKIGTDFSKLNSNVEVEIYIHVEGIKVNVPAFVVTLSELKDAIKEFVSMRNNPNKNDSVALYYKTEPYRITFESPSAGVLAERVEKIQQILKKVEECHNSIMSYLDMFEFSKSNSYSYKYTDIYEQQLVHYEEILQKQLKILENIVSNIKSEKPLTESDIFTHKATLKIVKSTVKEVEKQLPLVFGKTLIEEILCDKEPSIIYKEVSRSFDLILPLQTTNLIFVPVDRNGKEVAASFHIEKRDHGMWRKISHKSRRGQGLQSNYEVLVQADKRKLKNLCVTHLKFLEESVELPISLKVYAETSTRPLVLNLQLSDEPLFIENKQQNFSRVCSVETITTSESHDNINNDSHNVPLIEDEKVLPMNLKTDTDTPNTSMKMVPGMMWKQPKVEGKWQNFSNNNSLTTTHTSRFTDHFDDNGSKICVENKWQHFSNHNSLTTTHTGRFTDHFDDNGDEIHKEQSLFSLQKF